MSDEFDARVTHAVITLMEAAEDAGKPIVALDVAQQDENYYRLAISITGRRDHVDELIHLLQAKYPNADIQDTHDIDENNDTDGIFTSRPRGEA